MTSSRAPWAATCAAKRSRWRTRSAARLSWRARSARRTSPWVAPSASERRSAESTASGAPAATSSPSCACTWVSTPASGATTSISPRSGASRPVSRAFRVYSPKARSPITPPTRTEITAVTSVHDGRGTTSTVPSQRSCRSATASGRKSGSSPGSAATAQASVAWCSRTSTLTSTSLSSGRAVSVVTIRGSKKSLRIGGRRALK